MSALTPPLKWHDIELHRIPGCSGYAVSADGRVFSCWRSTGRPLCRQVQTDVWKELKPQPRKEDGRKRFTVRRDDGTYRRSYGSHLVLESFGQFRPEGRMEARHLNGICTDDSIKNLAWGTSAENKEDMMRHGTRRRGAQINTCKLNIAEVLSIRRRRAKGDRLSDLAERFGVTEPLISAIVNRKIWRHI